jgi:hypothetical protein
MRRTLQEFTIDGAKYLAVDEEQARAMGAAKAGQSAPSHDTPAPMESAQSVYERRGKVFSTVHATAAREAAPVDDYAFRAEIFKC